MCAADAAHKVVVSCETDPSDRSLPKTEAGILASWARKAKLFIQESMQMILYVKVVFQSQGLGS